MSPSRPSSAIVPGASAGVAPVIDFENSSSPSIDGYISRSNAALPWKLTAKKVAPSTKVDLLKPAYFLKIEILKSALRWNDYVLATIAFLERDRAALQRHRDRVAEGREAHFGNALNLRLLDALLRHFERDYRYATSHIE